MTLLIRCAIALCLASIAMPAHADSREYFWAAAWEQMVRASLPPDHDPHWPRSGRTTYDWRYKDRVELDALTAEYIHKLSSSGAFFFAPDLADYLQTLLLTVYPGSLPNGHPGSLTIHLLQSPEPNAMALSNGTILVTTGLVSLARNEAELLAVIAHEVGHVTLDHPMASVAAAKSRANLAAVFGVIAGVTAGVAAASSGDPSIQYYAGDIAVTSFVTATVLSAATLELVGAKRSRDQEKAADRLAQGWLRYARRDTLAYARILTRLRDWGQIRGVSPRASLADDHPSIGERLQALKLTPVTDSSRDGSYDGRIAGCIEHDAKLALAFGRYNDAIRLSDRVIESGWPDGATLVVRAAAMRNAYVDQDSLKAALALLDRAEKVHGYSDIGLFIERGLIHLRLKNEPAALFSFRQAEADLKNDGGSIRHELRDWLSSSIGRLSARTNQ